MQDLAKAPQIWGMPMARNCRLRPAAAASVAAAPAPTVTPARMAAAATLCSRWHAACLICSIVQTPPKYRQRTVAFIRLGAAALLAALVASVHAAAPPTALQDLGQLAVLAQAEAALHLSPLTEKQRFLVGPIPQQIRLARCMDAVRPSVGAAPHMKDRVLVELRCQSANAWHIYVPVRIVGTASVAVAAHAIVAGTVLTTKDMAVEQRDISALPPGYLDDPAIAVGFTASRAISGGAVLTNQQLLSTKTVQRGQTVTLVADAGGISVRMAGRALSDGLVNQRIRVENLSSGKIVEGIARSEQVVEIIFQ